MMKVPPLSLVGMERLPLPLPFSPELLWRTYSPLGPPPHPNGQNSPAAAAVAAFSRLRAGDPSNHSPSPSPLAQQLPFAYDIKHTIPLNLASDPRLWSREDVLTFMQWCEREFDLPSFEAERFQMNGKALCLLTKADLESRAPCSGDVIHNALQILMASSPSESPLTPHTPSNMRQNIPGKGSWSIGDLQQYASTQQQGTTSVTLSPAPSLDGQAGSPQDTNKDRVNSSSSISSSNGSERHNSDDSEYDSIGESPERSPVNQSSVSSSSPPPGNGNGNGNGTRQGPGQGQGQIQNTNKSSSSFKLANQTNVNVSDGGEYNNNGRLLWDFLQQLLNDPAQRYSSFITWKNVETGIFKIVDPPGLARLWGIQKNHLSMNYDKMSRALRYYYRVNILRKVQGERHCYQFLRNPGELKSIKNISMLRHQTQTCPVSLTVKGESSNPNTNRPSTSPDYQHQQESMLRRPTPSNYEILRHQRSPISLTTKLKYHNRHSHPNPHIEEDDEEDNEEPVQLTVKMEPSTFLEEDEYEEDVPTDLSMDTSDRDRNKEKVKDKNQD